jgi:hypothetical protein
MPFWAQSMRRNFVVSNKEKYFYRKQKNTANNKK